jgi:CheY-like chemotaxis protein
MARSAAGRVLVVEDDDDTRAAYRAILELAGWTVEEAASGDDALRLVLAAPPDVMIVDIAIPGMHGWEITRRVKAHDATRDVGVVAVTGHALDEDRRRARDAGCDGYLVKPVSADQLLGEVERLAAPATPRSPVEASGG